MTIDLEKEIVRENTATLLEETRQMEAQDKLDHEKGKVEQAVSEAYRAGIMSELGFEYELAESRRIRRERQDFAALPQNRIMSLNAIRAVCIKYELRFLPTRFYRGALDAGIGPAVENVKALLGGKLPVLEDGEVLGSGEWPGLAAGERKSTPQFYIAAPSSAFILQPRPQDPLLFLRLNSLKYYLVHKWGDDFNTADMRKGEVNERNWNSPFSDTARSDFALRASLSNVFDSARLMTLSAGTRSHSIGFGSDIRIR